VPLRSCSSHVTSVQTSLLVPLGHSWSDCDEDNARVLSWSTRSTVKLLAHVDFSELGSECCFVGFVLALRFRSNAASLSSVVFAALQLHIHTSLWQEQSSFFQTLSTHPLLHNSLRDHINSASYTHRIRIAAVDNMAPKQKMTQAQKAQSKAAASAKRKATLARNRARFGTPADEGNNMDNSLNEGQHRGAADPATPQDTVADASNDVEIPAKPSSRKRKAPVSGTVTPKQRKRRAAVTPAGSPVVVVGPEAAEEEEDDNASESEQEYWPAEEEVGPGNTTPELPNKSRKGSGKTKAGGKKSVAAEKMLAKERGVAVSGPQRMILKSAVDQVKKNPHDTLQRSRNVNLANPLVVNDAHLIWAVCERCIRHLDEGEHTPRLCYGCASVLTHRYRP